MKMTKMDEIGFRLAAADQGPWECDNGIIGIPGGSIIAVCHGNPVLAAAKCSAKRDENARFIAHAPTDIAYLKHRVEQLMSVVNEFVAATRTCPDVPLRVFEHASSAMKE